MLLISLFVVFLVVVVIENVEEDGLFEVLWEYLNWFYLLQVQEMLVENYFCIIDKDVVVKYVVEFFEIKLLIVDDVFGGWDKVQFEYLVDGGIFDMVFVN